MTMDQVQKKIHFFFLFKFGYDDHIRAPFVYGCNVCEFDDNVDMQVRYVVWTSDVCVCLYIYILCCEFFVKE